MLEKLITTISLWLEALHHRLGFAPFQPTTQESTYPSSGSYSIRYCYQEQAMQQEPGFSRVVGCGRHYPATPHVTHIYLVITAPELSCIREYCHICQQVLFRFSPSDDEIAELRASNIATTRLDNPPAEFVMANYLVTGQWPKDYQPLGPGQLTIDDLPEDMRANTAEGPEQ